MNAAIRPASIRSGTTPNNSRGRPPHWLDRLGVGVSVFCLLQCLAVPLALVFMPLASFGLFSHAWFHIILLALIIPVGVMAFALGLRRHRNRRVLVPAVLGLLLLLAAAVLEWYHVLAPGWISLVTSLGGLGMMTAHVMNIRAGRAV